MKKRLYVLLALALLSALNSQLSTLFAQGTAFTYQGRLNDANGPANGSFDLTFTLFATDTTGVAIAGPVTKGATVVTKGLFTAMVDFGAGVFTGGSNWLEIAVSTNGANAFTTLAPRQQLTPVPYALVAANVSGPIAASALPAAVVTNNANGLTLGGSFSGSGVGLTNVNAATLNGVSSAGFWKTTGNAGANPTNGAFLGTTDNLPVEFWVNTNRALRLEYAYDAGNHSVAPNVIGGYAGNIASNGVVGAFIGGGGLALNPNRVGDAYAAVVGGFGNTASGWASTAMGNRSTASGLFSTAMGWDATASGVGSTAMGSSVASGSSSAAMGASDAFGDYSTAMGNATAIGDYSTAMGNNTGASGTNSTAMGNGTEANGTNSTAMGYQTVAYGGNSTAMGNGTRANAPNSTAMGNHTSAFETNSTALGYQSQALGGNSTAIGWDTIASGNSSTAMGVETTASGDNSTAMGWGTTASGYASTAMGVDTGASGDYSTAIGLGTTASGKSSMAMGVGAGALHVNCFVWSDGHSVFSTAPYQFLIHADGGVGIGTTGPPPGGLNVASGGLAVSGASSPAYYGAKGVFIESQSTYGVIYAFDYTADTTLPLCLNTPGGNVGIGLTAPAFKLDVNGSINARGTVFANGVALTSDRNAKENFTAVNTREVLGKVANLPLTQWNYRTDGKDVRHLGPMAQDFLAAFGLDGADDKHISVVDEGGVALAAIQGLNQKVEEREARIQQQESRIQNQAVEIAALKQNLAELKQLVQSIAVRK